MHCFTPTPAEFRELSKQGNIVPVFTELIADAETPVGAFAKLDDGGYTFLFESVEKSEQSGRFSFVIAGTRTIVETSGRNVRITENGRAREFVSEKDPLADLEKLMSRYRYVPLPDEPPELRARFAGGAVGFLGYEAINFFEPTVPVAAKDDLQTPEMIFMITGSILIFDHRLRSLKILVNAFLEDGAPAEVYAKAAQSIEAIMRKLAQPTELPLVSLAAADATSPRSNFRREDFEHAVEQAKEYIRAGDVFQVVLSQRFESGFAGDPLDFYRCLRFINPSPYMFCLTFGDDLALVGSSPEMHVRLVGDNVEIRPIAGTRPRGATAAEDEQNASELLADAKERAEHIMLVDLARNDVGRIAEFGTVRVTELMNVERYSHVMHIV